jgi:hypothetical protein
MAWACSTIVLHHIVVAVLVVTPLFAHPQSFWSSISTHFLPCKQSLTAAQVLGHCCCWTLWGAQVILGIITIPSPHCCHPIVPIFAHPCCWPCCCPVFVLVLLSSLSSVVLLQPLVHCQAPVIHPASRGSQQCVTGAGSASHPVIVVSSSS